MVVPQTTQIYRQDAKARHDLLTKEQREDLIKPYLPPPAKSNMKKSAGKRQPLRDFVKTRIHILIYTIVQSIFSVYMRLRQTYHVLLDRTFAILYYHHRAPELIKQDVRGLSRIPEHLSVILELKGEERGEAGLEKLMDDVAEISTWCTCVGIPMLSIYEKTGTKKSRSNISNYLTLTSPRCSEGLHANNSSSRLSQDALILRSTYPVIPDTCSSCAIISKR